MTRTPYHSIQAQYRHLISTDMMQAKQGCRRCHGRGHVGYNPKRQVHIPCGCVVVDMDKLAAALNKVAVENKSRLVETNIPSLLPSLTDSQGQEQDV